MTSLLPPSAPPRPVPGASPLKGRPFLQLHHLGGDFFLKYPVVFHKKQGGLVLKEQLFNLYPGK